MVLTVPGCYDKGRIIGTGQTFDRLLPCCFAVSGCHQQSLVLSTHPDQVVCPQSSCTTAQIAENAHSTICNQPFNLFEISARFNIKQQCRTDRQPLKFLCSYKPVSASVSEQSGTHMKVRGNRVRMIP